MLVSRFACPIVLALAVSFVSGCGTPGSNLDALAEADAASGPVSPGPIDADAPEEFTTTKSGLKYRIRRKGNGATPKSKSTVVLHYKGWLDDGNEFDSSYARGERAEFRVSQVVPGFSEGLQLVQEGGMIELEIPSPLGYGANGSGPIPPNSTLHFLVEVFHVY